MNLISELNQRNQEDRALRPQSLADFYGQTAVLEILRVCITSAKRRGQVLDHVLIMGPPGVGKSTLSQIIAREMQGNLQTTSGPMLTQPKDIIRLLSNLNGGDILFIDEIHRLPMPCEEVLYSAMEDMVIDVLVGGELSPQSVKIHLNPFTLIGATTRQGYLSQPLKSRFGLDLHLDLYPFDDLRRILARSAKLLLLNFHEAALDYLVCCSRMTPRIGNKLLRRLRDFVWVADKQDVPISLSFVQSSLQKLGIDRFGCSDLDRRILMTLINRTSPLGLKTLAAIINEEQRTLEDDHEPFLLRQGWIEKTARGRKISEQAIAIVNQMNDPSQSSQLSGSSQPIRPSHPSGSSQPIRPLGKR